MNDIAANRSDDRMLTGRLNLSYCGRECGKRPNQRLCSVSSRRSHFRVPRPAVPDDGVAVS